MKTLVLVLLCLVSIGMWAQQNDEDKLVTVPQKYVSAEGMQHQVSTDVGQWAGMGKEIGVATKEALNAVLDSAEKFGTTRVGYFVMAMVAWRIMGAELVHILLGIPMLIIGAVIWWRLMQRFFFGYRVVARKEGKAKYYADHPAYQFKSSDARAGAGVVLSITFVAFLIGMLCMIFA